MGNPLEAAAAQVARDFLRRHADPIGAAVNEAAKHIAPIIADHVRDVLLAKLGQVRPVEAELDHLRAAISSALVCLDTYFDGAGDRSEMVERAQSILSAAIGEAVKHG